MGRKKEEIDEKTKNLTYPKTRKPKKNGKHIKNIRKSVHIFRVSEGFPIILE